MFCTCVSLSFLTCDETANGCNSECKVTVAPTPDAATDDGDDENQEADNVEGQMTTHQIWKQQIWFYGGNGCVNKAIWACFWVYRTTDTNQLQVQRSFSDLGFFPFGHFWFQSCFFDDSPPDDSPTTVHNCTLGTKTRSYIKMWMPVGLQALDSWTILQLLTHSPRYFWLTFVWNVYIWSRIMPWSTNILKAKCSSRSNYFGCNHKREITEKVTGPPRLAVGTRPAGDRLPFPGVSLGMWAHGSGV